jgi:hypothetical protein
MDVTKTGDLTKERESIFATLEVLADRTLTDRLLSLPKTRRQRRCC